MISRRSLIGGAVLSFAAPSVLRAQSPRVLKISHQYPGGTADEGDFRDRLCRRFAADVQDRTGGSLAFEIHPASSLMKPNAELAALRKGSLDLSLYPLAYAGSEIHALSLGLMPCLIRSYSQAAKWKDASIGRSLEKIAEEKGVKFISWVWQAAGVVSKSKPLTAPDDVKGVKIRGGGRGVDLMFSAAGAQVSTMPSSEIYAGMQSGALDAAMTSSTSLMSFKLEDFAKALTTARKSALGFMLQPLVMSKAVFDSLDPELQKAVTDVGQEMEWFAEVEAKKDDEAVAKVYAAKGATVVDLSADDFGKWQAIAEGSAWKDFAAKSPEAAELLASAQSV
jgi:TRAP-type transport system periplasmic protein